MKKILAIFLCAVMFISQFAITSSAADSAKLESIEVLTVPLVENVDGYIEYAYDENEELVEYFYYVWEYAVDAVTLNYSDGTSETVPIYFLEYEAEFTQHYYNQWTVGNSYQVTLFVEDVQCTFEVEIESSPVASMEVLETVQLIENIDGYMWWDYDDYYNEHEYFCYDTSLAVKSVLVNYTDGTSEVITQDHMNFYNLYITDDQSYDNQWTAGSHTATVTYLGKSCEFIVDIIPNTIESIEVYETASLLEYIDGGYTYEYDDDYNEARFFLYDSSCSVVSLKINHNDGTSEIVDPMELSNVQITDEQAYDNQWTAGTHSATVAYGGKSCEFALEIVENGVANIEVIETIALQKGVDCRDDYYVDDNGVIWEYSRYEPEGAVVKIKVNYNDGTTEEVYMDDMSILLYYVESEQSYNVQWTVGNTYKATLNLYGKSCQFDVSVEEPCDYDFIVENGEIYIMGWSEQGLINRKTEITIPEEIFGYPVVGVVNLEDKTIDVKTIIIPDSVQFIGAGAFEKIKSLEKVVLGKNVTGITYNMFYRNSGLKSIEVSSDNAEYTSVDGVLFNKDITELVAYPEGKGDTYTIPASVTDITVTFFYDNVEFVISEDSEAFTMEDGVIYSKDKKTLIRVPADISGLYIIPDTVEAIGMYAFINCTELDEIMISNAVTEIGEGAFAACTSLKAVLLPGELTYLGDVAFFGCTSLEGIIIQDKLETIGMMPFFGAEENFEIHYTGTQSDWDALEISEWDKILLEDVEINCYGGTGTTPHVLNGRVVFTNNQSYIKEPLASVKLDEETEKYMGFDKWIIKGSADDAVLESCKLFYAPQAPAALSAEYFVLGNADNSADGSVDAIDLLSVCSAIKESKFIKYADTDFDESLTSIDLLNICSIIKGTYIYE